MAKIYTPLIDAIQSHVKKQPVSFHVPGHKNGLFFHSALYEDFKPMLPYDLTELTGLDDLHAPDGAIKEAQDAAADLYGASETHFLVGGSTVGNLAALYGLFERGDIVFVQRNSHKSVFHAMQIAGLTPILLSPQYDEETGLAIGIDRDTLEKAIKSYPMAKGLVLTYPNYYGISIDIDPLIKLAKDHRLLVVTDEAHAAHFCLGDPFPPSSLALGADVVVQSAHKMLPALTMSSFLHIHNNLSIHKRHSIKEALTMFQSSSPSYLLLASLDGARAYVENLTEETLFSILAGIKQVREELATIDQLHVVNWERSGYHFDPLKVTIKSTTELTGFELQDLFAQVGLTPELADDQHVLLVFGLGIPDLEDRIELVRKALAQYEPLAMEKRSRLLPDILEVAPLKLYSKPIRLLPKRSVLLDEAVGLISAETIIPYPPGIPLLLPGETIEKSVVTRMKQLQQAGATFQGHQELVRILVVNSEDRHE